MLLELSEKSCERLLTGVIEVLLITEENDLVLKQCRADLRNGIRIEVTRYVNTTNFRTDAPGDFEYLEWKSGRTGCIRQCRLSSHMQFSTSARGFSHWHYRDDQSFVANLNTTRWSSPGKSTFAG